MRPLPIRIPFLPPFKKMKGSDRMLYTRRDLSFLPTPSLNSSPPPPYVSLSLFLSSSSFRPLSCNSLHHHPPKKYCPPPPPMPPTPTAAPFSSSEYCQQTGDTYVRNLPHADAFFCGCLVDLHPSPPTSPPACTAFVRSLFYVEFPLRTHSIKRIP